ncbi:hypothetical protein CW304_26965 [Bacillus sp. UFRGS-B20]|nr:hypothetical protein CW304_26965 [Bacillus sp. UFRGS-B20]
MEKPFVLKITEIIIVAFKTRSRNHCTQQEEVKVIDKLNGKLVFNVVTQTLAKSGEVFGEISNLSEKRMDKTEEEVHILLVLSKTIFF